MRLPAEIEPYVLRNAPMDIRADCLYIMESRGEDGHILAQYRMNGL